MRLALTAGRLDFRRVMRQMDERDFAAWQQFEREEPFGPDALNRGLARVGAAALRFEVSERQMMLRPESDEE